MNDWRSSFDQILTDRLIPEFCSDPKRGFDVAGFQQESVRVTEEDARYFMMAWNAGLVEHQGRGLYRAPNSAASEQFFWSGSRKAQPRSFTLWLEPIITVAGLARLHFDHGWPISLIGTQSPEWAFDLVAFLPGQRSEHIAGEVKKTRREIEDLIGLMQRFGQKPNEKAPPAGKARNAFKKVNSLRLRRAPLFWALGPAGFSKAYRVSHQSGDIIHLLPVHDDALRFPSDVGDNS